MLAIGLDIGTTSVCGILYDIESGKQIKAITEANDTFIKADKPWKKLQDPVALINKLCDIEERLESIANSKIACIGITGQMHGIVYLNDKGEPISPLAIWQDGRGDQIYSDNKSYAEYLSELTGYQLATGYGAVTYFYDTVNNLVPLEAVTFCTIHDLAAMTLSNSKKPLLHTSDAASLGLFDLNKCAFDTDAIVKAGLNPALFPAVTDGFKCIGKTDSGIPVSIAIGDNQASFIGSVADMQNSILINVGTGSQISAVVNSVPKDTKLDCRPLMQNDYIMAGSSLCGGRAYAILEKFFREVASVVTGQEIKSAYPAIDKLMENYSQTTEPLYVDTTFCGTRTDPSKRATISGISIDNFTVGDMCNGFMNGIANELYEMYNSIKPLLANEPTVMVGSGNGIRFNKQLCNKFKEMFGLDLMIPAHKEEAAFGAMLYCLVASEVFDSISSAQKLIKYV